MRRHGGVLWVLLWILLGGVVAQMDQDEMQKAIYFLKGTEEHNKGNFRECLLNFKEYAKLSPTTDFAWTNQGVCLEKLQLWQEAIAIYDTCLLHIPDNINCLNAKCTVLLMVGASELAYNLSCGRAHDVDPQNAKALHNWGVVHVNRFEYQKSIELLQQSYKNDPSDIKSLSNLCNALSRGGWCDWCMGNLTRLFQVSNASSSYLSSSTFRGCCFVNDKKSIQHKWIGLRKHVEEVNARLSAIGVDGICKNWKLETSYQMSWSTTLTLPRATYGTDFINVIPEGAHLEDPVSMVNEEKPISLWKLGGVCMEGTAGVLFHDYPTCSVYVSDHLWSTRIAEEWTGLPHTVVQINEMVASPIQFNMRNHYHLMAETLGRIVVLRKYLTSTLPNVKLLLPLNDENRSQMLQIIDILKIKEEEYLKIDIQKNVRYHFAAMWIVDWRSQDIHGNPDPWSVFYPPASVLQLTSTTVLDSIGYKKTSLKDWKILYVSRSDAGVRTVRNESLLLSTLKSLYNDHVQVFVGKSLSFVEQIRMFRDSTIIISPHGAALANLMWVKKGTDLILFPLQPHVDQCFLKLCGAMGVKLTLATEIGAYYYGHYTLDQQKVDLVISEVNKILSRKNLKVKEDL